MESLRFFRFESMIGSAAKSIARLKSTGMARFQLSAAHTSCLLHLLSAPDGLTQTGLREALGMDRAQVSRVLHQLCDRDYVASSGAGYNRVYRLTQTGSAVAREIDGIVSEVLAFVSDSIPKEAIEAFYHTFSIIAANLSEAERRLFTAQRPQEGHADEPKEELL